VPTSGEELTGTLQLVRTAKTSNAAIIVLAVAVFAAVAAVVVGGLGATRTDEVAAETFDPARISDVPSVMGKRETGGFELLGLRFDAPDRSLGVVVKPPADCLRSADGEEVVIGGAGCDAVESVAGAVKGGGVTVEGERWVELWVEVDADCYRAAAIGDAWPDLPESCR
jgi:hypothetical protein